MKSKLIMQIVLIFLLGIIGVRAQNSAMTYNIRYATERDGVNQWENRKEWLANVVRFYEPDILGIQEGLKAQVSFLDESLIGYSYVGVGRDDAKEDGEYAAIFYKEEKLEVLDSGTFWLSETPNEPSYGWGANYRRISTWAKFKLKETGQEYWAFNTHFDHETPLARLNSAKLIANRISKWNTEDLPVLVMGDFNATPESPPIKYFSTKLEDSRLASKVISIGPEGTYNAFDVSHLLDQRIDYIFVTPSFSVKKYAAISETRDQRTPSDHLPVFIEFSINE